MSNPERWRHFPPLPADIQERLARLPDFLAQTGVQLAYLFGSLAQSGRPANDVDLALLTAEGQPPFRLRQAIVERLGTERVDVVDLGRASPVLKFEIISHGRCLYAASAEERLDFELAAVRLYQDTAYLRRCQQELLKKRMEAWS